MAARLAAGRGRAAQLAGRGRGWRREGGAARRPAGRRRRRRGSLVEEGYVAVGEGEGGLGKTIPSDTEGSGSVLRPGAQAWDQYRLALRLISNSEF